jgi:hypothetical protein
MADRTSPFASPFQFSRAISPVQLQHETEYEKALGIKYDLTLTAEDLEAYTHFSPDQRQFMVSFIMRWQNKALDKKKAAVSNAFLCILERVKANKIAAAEKEREELKIAAIQICKTKPSKEDRTPEDVTLVTKWLSKARLNNEKLALSPPELNILASSIGIVTLPPKTPLFIQGDPGLNYYWVLAGSVTMYSSFTAAQELKLRENFKSWNRVDPLELPTAAVLGSVIFKATEGLGFGELSLIDSKTMRSLSAATSSDGGTTLIVVDKSTYNASLVALHREKMNLLQKVALMNDLKVFSTWTKSAIIHTSYAMERLVYGYNNVIAKMNQKMFDIFIICDGQCAVTTSIAVKATNILDSETRSTVAVADVFKGTIIGDIDIMEGSKKYGCTYTVKSSECVVLAMRLDDFKQLIMKAPDGTGDKILQGAAALKAYREERLVDVQKKEVKIKKQSNEEAFGNSEIVKQLEMKQQKEKLQQTAADVTRKGSRRRGSYQAGDFKEKRIDQIMESSLRDVLDDKPILSPLLSGGGRKIISTSKSAADGLTINPSVANNNVDPFTLPGLKATDVPTTPGTLRRIRVRSMTGDLVDERKDNSSSPSVGFQHYGAKLNSSFRDFNAVPYAAGSNAAGGGAAAVAALKDNGSGRGSFGGKNTDGSGRGSFGQPGAVPPMLGRGSFGKGETSLPSVNGSFNGNGSGKTRTSFSTNHKVLGR